MAYFDYGYFSFSQKRIDKFDPKVERKKLVKKRTIINKLLANEMGKEFYDGKIIPDSTNGDFTKDEIKKGNYYKNLKNIKYIT